MLENNYPRDGVPLAAVLRGKEPDDLAPGTGQRDVVQAGFASGAAEGGQESGGGGHTGSCAHQSLACLISGTIRR
jgi:hypothetical protein